MKEEDIVSKAWTGCANSVIILFCIAAILVALKLAGLVDVTWVEATMSVWLPTACVLAALTAMGVIVMILFIGYLITGGVCIIIDKIKAWRHGKKS